MAAPSDLRLLAELFDGYRQFYQQTADIERARDFIGERLARNDSWILVAEQQDELLGFCQLYPSFSSTTTSRIAILNDALLRAAEELGKNLGVTSLELATAISNTSAQSLYEKQDWNRDQEFYYYSKHIPS